MTIDTVEDAHSPKGPSSGERITNCVGSLTALPKHYSQGRTSIYAAEGTAAHELSEWARLQKRPCRDFIGQVIHVEGYTFTVDQEMADHVQEFVDWCEKEPGDQFVEIQVRYSEYMKGGYGRLDDARARDGTVVITDLKYGKVLVPVENNTQLRMYALGFYLTYGHLYDIEAFRLRISQPRVEYKGDEVITVEQLIDWADRVLRPAEAKIEAGVLEFNAGPWCKYCPLKLSCETRQQWMAEQTPTMQSIVDPATEFEDIDSIDEKLAAVVNDPPVHTPGVEIPPERLRLMLQAARPVIKYFKDIQSYAKQLLLKGGVTQEQIDFKLVAGRSERVYTQSAEKVADHLSLELDDEQIWEPREIKSPAQLEKVLGKKHAFFASEYIDKKPGKPTLAPSSDKRKALTSDQLTQFEDLGESEAEEEN